MWEINLKYGKHFFGLVLNKKLLGDQKKKIRIFLIYRDYNLAVGSLIKFGGNFVG